MSMYPFESEEDDLLSQLDQEEIYQEETFGSRLRLFYAQFSSGTKALLSDSLFREVAEQGTIYRLEISCPNEIIYRRLLSKRQKIANEIRWIWPDTMKQFALLIDQSPLSITVFYLKS